jgi:hypothetical protein
MPRTIPREPPACYRAATVADEDPAGPFNRRACHQLTMKIAEASTGAPDGMSACTAWGPTFIMGTARVVENVPSDKVVTDLLALPKVTLPEVLAVKPLPVMVIVWG